MDEHLGYLVEGKERLFVRWCAFIINEHQKYLLISG